MYFGYKEIMENNPDLSELYSHPTVNTFDLFENEYLVVRNDKGEELDIQKWDGEKYKHISYQKIENAYSGRISPRNTQQKMAFDMLQDDKSTIKVLTGVFGSFKTGAMVVHALDFIQKGKYDKIIWVRNNVEVKDAGGLGFLPGDRLSKLLEWAMPLADHVGGVDELIRFTERGVIDIQHLGYLRGRDLRNSIILCSEAENLTTQHVQLLIGRVSEGSTLWLDGDYKQVDKKVFKENSGMAKAVERLTGNPLFAYVNMPISERSATARLADLLD